MGSFSRPEAPDGDRRYVRRAMAAPLLRAEDELELARLWREKGDQTAMHRLVSAYLRLVIATASRFRHYGLPMADLVQEGNIGLMQAVGRFEPERSVRFATYATWWIRAAIQDYVLRNWSIVRTGTTAAHKSLFFNLRRLRARIEREEGMTRNGELTDAGRRRIARELGVETGDVLHMEGRLQASDRSLNAPVADEAETDWQDLLPDERQNPEEAVVDMHDGVARARWLERALADLTPRERTIIAERRLRDEGRTLEVLGTELGISKERVRQIEHQALRKLRDRLTELAGDPLDSGLVPA